FTHITVTDMINVTQVLPMPTEDTFVLQGRAWKLPTYESIDEFISGWVECGLLSYDPIVRDILENRTVKISARSIQRHFAMTIGLSPRCVKQITSAPKGGTHLLQSMPLD